MQTLPYKKVRSLVLLAKMDHGKSTLAKLIGGITKPNKGKILIDGLDTSQKNNFMQIRKKVGMVFQNPENQILFPKVEDEISFILHNLKLDNEKIRIENALKQVGMQGKEKCNTYELSLGQKQRIAIATMLSINPKYLVLDEPTAMLDQNGKDHIYQIIQNLKNKGYTIIFVTNQTDEISLADQIIVVEDGKIKERNA